MTERLPRILVIGDQGQVAWELKRTLAPLGELMALGRHTEPGVDLVKPEALRERIMDFHPDWVINAAAYTAVDRAEQEPELATAVNATAPGVMAEMAREIGALLVHYSTDYVFDGSAGEPYREEAATNPKSVYGRTKLMGEKAIQDVACDHVILRTSWVYGARGQNFLRTIRRLAREREELSIVADQRGAPTSARQIAEATALLLARMPQDRSRRRDLSGVYHLTAGGETTWHEFACHVVEHQRRHEPVKVREIKPIATTEYPLPAMRPSYSVLDNAKLRRTFGIGLPDWRVGLAHVYEELMTEKG